MADVIDTIQEARVEPPIEVHESPLPDQVWAFLRQMLPPIVAFAVGRGLIKDDIASLVLTLGGIVAPIIVGQLKTRLRALQLSMLEKHVDNSVAKAKP